MLRFDFQRISSTQSRILYSLYGIVSHSGGMHGGHYVAYVKVRERHPELNRNFLAAVQNDQKAAEQKKTDLNENQVQTEDLRFTPPPGEWFYVSDSHFSKVPQNQVLAKEAYILFYERIQ